MNILLSVFAHDDCVRVTTSVIDASHELDERQAPTDLQNQDQPLALGFTKFEGPVKAAFELHTEGRQSRTIKFAAMEAPAEALLTGEPSSVELGSKPPTRVRSYQQWLSPNALQVFIQLFFIVTFCSVLYPYMKYAGAKKAAKHEVCKKDARTLYENNLAQCDVKAAISLRGGALGLNWLEMSMVIATAVAWYYLTWLARGWLGVRTPFLKKDHKE
ncbi:hypothetical protein A1O7_08363 [Cladophialophora yegresii CBS 114405]|uniref:Uncharacterized protein n=1 Tax=Cladophialophora yegresii CBS 114405 TaxID=1182544 RepID=W9VTF9_9EURO|nr:uncharacterized protein A1O7_08363 [Cladophialophora yegresii CBS 114405]EXJ55436.1 hypothetical protein A1O7_08363 [Cladophialophora yegresii CBS 114405]